jgi:hypothetical protein
MSEMPVALLSCLVGLIAGIVLGLAAKLGHFTTLPAIESAYFNNDQRRIRLWAIVMGVAIIGTFGFDAIGLIKLSETQGHALQWNPLASLLGGLTFGYGMALAGNCGFGALVSLGGGNLRALVVISAIGIAAYATQIGLLAPVRYALFPQDTALGPQGFAHFLSSEVGLAPFAFAVLVGSALITWALAHIPLRSASPQIYWGVAAGLAIVFSYIGTTNLHFSGPGGIAVEGPSFTTSLGQFMIYVMTGTLGGNGFSVGLVAGVILGGFVGAVVRGHFLRDAGDGEYYAYTRQIAGGLMMGVGGTLAMGCAIGQGISATAALTWSGPVTLIAIVAGAFLRIRQGGYLGQPE